MTKEQIIDKARKLKALATSPNPNEAALALKMMQAMLAKHGLTEIDLEKDEFGRLTFSYSSDLWVKVAVNEIASLYFCRMAYKRVNLTKLDYIIVGSDQNALAVKEMAVPILDAIRRESKQAACKTSFCNGAATQIAVNCRELVAAAKRGELSDETGVALVIGDLYKKTHSAIDRYMDEKMGVVTKKISSKKRVDMPSYMRGKTYGNTVELQKKVTAN